MIILGQDGRSKIKSDKVKAVLNPQANRRLITSRLNSLITPDEEEQKELSNREKEILRQVALGKTNKEIADTLFISIHTVITHRKKITARLGIKSIAGLTVYAILNGLVGMEEVE